MEKYKNILIHLLRNSIAAYALADAMSKPYGGIGINDDALSDLDIYLKLVEELERDSPDMAAIDALLESLGLDTPGIKDNTNDTL